MDASRPADAADPANLIAHLAWVRRLAHALVANVDHAEDVAQDAVRVTLEQPADRVRGTQMKSWLRGVVRRLVLDRSRADASRSARERAVAPSESEPATHEVVARLDQQQRVARAVRELAEPYRSTILYRYLDSLSTREVAKRMGVSDEVVRKRLLRGLAQLRERLDAEFGSDTKSWAVALLSLPGAAVVGVKAKLAVAAVVVVAAAVTWRSLLPAGEPRPSEPPPAVAAAAPAAASSEPPAPAANAPAVREAATDVGTSARPTATETGDATILHVSVVAADKRPCTTGHLAGFWSEDLHGGHAPPTRSLEEEIAGPVTDLILPVTAASVVLTASVDGQPPSQQTWFTELRKEKDPKARHGRVEKSVTLEVGGHEQGPRLTGRILVDGEAIVPRGFALEVQSEPIGEARAQVRVHALDATYEVGPIDARIRQLIVTSDETVPRLVDVDFGDVDFGSRDETLDLDLETGRTLRLTVVDRGTNQRLAGVELYLTISYVTKTTLFNQYWRDHSHFMRTGRDGVAVVTGLPPAGRFDVHRDAARVERTMEVNAGEKMKLMQPAEPLLSFELTKRSPAIVEQTLRLDAEGRALHVFGQLSAEFLAEGAMGEEAAEVHYATIRAGDRWYRNDDTIAHDEQGHWKLDVKPDTEYRIFVERERRRVSQVASVKVEGDDVGPVGLRPRPGTDVTLRLLRCPPDGFVSIFVEDPGAVTPLGTTRPVHGGTYERKLRLDGPTRVEVSWFKDQRDHHAGTSKTMTVDPATMPVVEFDLASEAARDVELTLSSGKLPDEASLHLMQVAADGAPRAAQAEVNVDVAFVHGRCRNPVAIPPGRYLYGLLPQQADALLVGVVDVVNGPADRPIAIRCELEPHKKAELRAGVELSEVGGVKLAERWKWFGRLHFSDHGADHASNESGAGADTILLPAGAKFTILEK